MKKLILFTVISSLLFSCSNNPKPGGESSKIDTTAHQDRTLLAYRLLDSSFHTEYGYRVTKKRLKMSPADSLKNEWSLDTVYFIPHPIQNPDSLKKGIISWANISKELILIDGGKNIDSLFKKYTLHFPKPDTTKK